MSPCEGSLISVLLLPCKGAGHGLIKCDVTVPPCQGSPANALQRLSCRESGLGETWPSLMASHQKIAQIRWCIRLFPHSVWSQSKVKILRSRRDRQTSCEETPEGWMEQYMRLTDTKCKEGKDHIICCCHDNFKMLLLRKTQQKNVCSHFPQTNVDGTSSSWNTTTGT